jgi:predicted N-acyltransferase
MGIWNIPKEIFKLKIEFDDFCPRCGEACTHVESDDFYSVKCHSCKFSGTWESLDDFMAWFDSQRVRRVRTETRKAKREARRLNSLE